MKFFQLQLGKKQPRIRKINSPFRASTGSVRYGYTLVEMAAVVAITGSLMSLAVVTFRQSIQAHQLAMETLLHHRQLDAVRWQLKKDLAVAQSASLDGDSRLVLIEGHCDFRNDQDDSRTKPQAPHSVVYRFGRDSITRTVYSKLEQEIVSREWLTPVLLSDIQLESAGTYPLATVILHVARNRDDTASDKIRWAFRVGREVH